MQLEHEFTVPVGIDDAWAVLLDIERVAPCMPGAALDSVDGDGFTGTVKVKLGPIGLTYKGKASFVEKDETTHRAVIDARGRDARGNGTANAKVTATLAGDGSSTKVTVVTDLDITGKPAQFGRGVMVDVGNKLIGQFADCLAGKLADGAANGTSQAAGPDPAQAGPGRHPSPGSRPASGSRAASQDDASTPANDPVTPASAVPTPSAVQAPSSVRSAPPQAQPINLLESAGPAVAKRLAPVAIAAVMIAVMIRRRRGRSR